MLLSVRKQAYLSNSSINVLTGFSLDKFLTMVTLNKKYIEIKTNALTSHFYKSPGKLTVNIFFSVIILVASRLFDLANCSSFNIRHIITIFLAVGRIFLTHKKFNKKIHLSWKNILYHTTPSKRGWLESELYFRNDLLCKFAEEYLMKINFYWAKVIWSEYLFVFISTVQFPKPINI